MRPGHPGDPSAPPSTGWQITRAGRPLAVLADVEAPPDGSRFPLARSTCLWVLGSTYRLGSGERDGTFELHHLGEADRPGAVGGETGGGETGRGGPVRDTRALARIEHLGHEHWTLTADGVIHRFRRASLWHAEQNLLAGRASATSGPLGAASIEESVVRSGPRRRRSARRPARGNGLVPGVEADLPGLDDLYAAFAAGAVLVQWAACRRTAAR